MKFSKLLKMMLGLAGLFSMGVVEDGGGSTGALDTNEAAGLFSSLLDGEPKEKEAAESPEAAAEKLAAEDLAGAQQDPVDDGAAAAVGDKVTIEVDGKTVELTKAELAEHYKNGMRQADYTRKTMEAADVRKTADAELQQARQERATLAQQLNNFAIKTHGDLQEQAALLTEELLLNDPLEYMRQERTFKERQANLANAQQRLAHLNQQHQAEQDESVKAYMSAQQQELLAKLPEWKDPEKAKAEAASIRQYMATQGFTQERIGSITDHADVLMARKAMMYDALIARAGAATKKVAALPTKVERPGNGDAVKPTDGRTDSMKRLSKSGSVNDAASVFAQMF